MYRKGQGDTYGRRKEGGECPGKGVYMGGERRAGGVVYGRRKKKKGDVWEEKGGQRTGLGLGSSGSGLTANPLATSKRTHYGYIA